MSTERDRTVFVAGASGVVGQILCRLLVRDGWRVTGTTRSQDKATALRALGVSPVVVDVFDAPTLIALVHQAQPRVVIHQLTDLPDALDPAQMAEALVRNARVREEGTRNLIAAAKAAGTKRVVAQSIAFAYAPGPIPYTESAPLKVDDPAFGLTARAVASLEAQVLGAPLEGIVLRYGRFYGPGTGFDRPRGAGSVHVDAAADAARRAAARGPAGIYNIAEDDGTVCSDKAANELGWKPDFRIETDAPRSPGAPG